MSGLTESIDERIRRAERAWLFLDYDGTLAEFVPTPDHVEPQAEVLELVAALHQHSHLRVAMISGRSLEQLERLVAVQGIILAGTYGIEVREADGTRNLYLPDAEVLPELEGLKTAWSELLAGRDGFFLEDKRWALAVHAKLANEREAAEVIDAARVLAEPVAALSAFRIQGGPRFLEAIVQTAGKGGTIRRFLESYSSEKAVPIFIGDDDRDEPGFEVVNQHGGISIVVSETHRKSHAQYRLASPGEVRAWLWELLAKLQNPN